MHLSRPKNKHLKLSVTYTKTQSCLRRVIDLERPILFNTDMVKAILEGRKTQTRRIIKPQLSDEAVYITDVDATGLITYQTHNKFLGGCAERKPPCQVGDTLWVRETFYQYGEWFDIPQTDEYGDVINKRTFIPQHESKYSIYFADTLPKDLKILKGYKSGRGYYKRPSLFMPRSAARLFLKVTDVRVERLQDMPHDAPMKEGIRSYTKDGTVYKFAINEEQMPWKNMPRNPTEAFKILWDSIYHNWNENPWVWVIEFEKLDLCEHGIYDYCQKADGCTYCTEDMI